MPQPFSIRAQPATVGAEVSGVQLGEPLSAEALGDLHRALLRYQVLSFPDQDLDDEQHLEFSRHWGRLQVHVLDQYRHEGRPEIFLITNLDANGRPKGEHPDPGARVWHSDGSWAKERGLVTSLHSLRAPASGGDTLYANMYAAYDGLSAEDKLYLDPLVAVHDLDYSRRRTDARKQMSEEQKRNAPPVEWPIVRAHPETGPREALIYSRDARCIRCG